MHRPRAMCVALIAWRLPPLISGCVQALGLWNCTGRSPVLSGTHGEHRNVSACWWALTPGLSLYLTFNSRMGHRLEYCAPESLRHDQDGTLRQVTSKSDMWSLGMVLHKLVYFRLPWKNDENLTELENEIIGFQGCVS